MAEKKIIPEIRFAGFTDAWEQRKLEDVVGVYDGTHQTPNYQDHGVMFVSVEDIQTLTSEKYISEEDYEKNYSVVPEQGDILMTRIGDIGTASIVKSAEPLAYYVSLALLKNKGMNSEFLKANISAPAFQNELWLRTLHTAYPKKINKDEIGKCMISIAPIIEEQEAIGRYFESLDNLITLHQRKYEQLKNVKKSMLEKMFPRNDADVPEIRFEGFTDPWEQRKLSEIATMHARIGWQNLRKSEFLDSGDYYLITGTDFVDGEVDLANCHYITKDRYDQDPNIQIENGSILITKDGTLGKVAYVKGLEKPATLNAGVFNVLIRDKKCVYGKYLFQYLKAPFLLNYVAQKATGGTIKHLNQEILVDFPVVLPDYDEQVLLGNAFDDLDNLITLHQCKYEKLKQIKKSMLEKMFV